MRTRRRAMTSPGQNIDANLHILGIGHAAYREQAIRGSRMHDQSSNSKEISYDSLLKRDFADVVEENGLDLPSGVPVPHRQLLPGQFVVRPMTENRGADDECTRPDYPHLPTTDAESKEQRAAQGGEDTQKKQPAKLRPRGKGVPDRLFFLFRLFNEVEGRHHFPDVSNMRSRRRSRRSALNLRLILISASTSVGIFQSQSRSALAACSPHKALRGTSARVCAPGSRPDSARAAASMTWAVKADSSNRPSSMKCW